MKQNFKTTVELERKAVEALRELYPQRWALKTFFNACLWKLVEIHDHDMDKEIAETVEGALEELKGEEE